mgnify:CR=1 FL=1
MAGKFRGPGSIVRSLAAIAGLSAALALGACAMPDLDSFRAPDAAAFNQRLSVSAVKERQLKPVTNEDLVDQEGRGRGARGDADGAETAEHREVELGRGLHMEARQALQLDELGELDGVGGMAAADHDDGKRALDFSARAGREQKRHETQRRDGRRQHDRAQAAGPFAGPGSSQLSRGSLLRHEKLIDFIGRQKGTSKVRPDQKIVFQRGWENEKDRIQGMRRLMADLAKLVA